jgi:hypothetical protein
MSMMVFPIFTVGDDARDQLKFSGERQLTALVEWARQIPHFLDLPLGDQVSILQYRTPLYRIRQYGQSGTLTEFGSSMLISVPEAFT